MDEITLQEALAQAEAAFTQAAVRGLETADAQERAALWNELTCTYDKTLAWWPREAPGFRRLTTLRAWAHQLGDVRGRQR
jgi:hypothetical protein